MNVSKSGKLINKPLYSFSITAFKMETAKRKYMYLLNLAKKKGLQNKQFLMESNEAAQS